MIITKSLSYEGVIQMYEVKKWGKSVLDVFKGINFLNYVTF